MAEIGKMKYEFCKKKKKKKKKKKEEKKKKKNAKLRNKKKITSTMRWYNLRNQAHPVSTPMNLVHVRVPQELLNPQNTSPHKNGKMIQTPTLGCNWQQQWEVSFIDCRKGSLTVNIWQSSPNKFP